MGTVALTGAPLHLRVAETLEAAVEGEETYDFLEALSYHYDAAGKSEPVHTHPLTAILRTR